MDTIYFLIDGENIDATLGVNILKRFPRGEERPRWDRVLHYNPWQPQRDYPQSAGAALAHHDPESIAHISEDDSASVPPSHVTPAIFNHSFHRDASPTQSNSNSTVVSPPSSAEIVAELMSEEQTNADPRSSAQGLFFLNASQRVATSFVQALLAIGWQPILLTSQDPELKIVDIGIQKTIEAIVQDKPGAKVVIASHDVDYLPQIEMLLDAGHEVAVLCFREYLSLSLAELEDRGLKIIDLEYDVNAFTIPLSRVTTIDIADFNPHEFI
ncbi:uncharacterized protein J2S36_001359 [Arcanobacterium hippocoleae]|uniref:NYN domain-containing protein n=1 Tax=Arcanobacterium hippocoleae TaxID=149017 RepID=A0ABU1T367_9ACTO|nr:uncharacterized protein [Arcanobacterium hippocoleae]